MTRFSCCALTVRIKVLNEHHFITLLPVYHFVHKASGEKDAKPPGAKSKLIPIPLMSNWIVRRIRNGGVADFIQRETFTGIFHTAQDHVAGTQVRNFYIPIGIESPTMFDRV